MWVVRDLKRVRGLFWSQTAAEQPAYSAEQIFDRQNRICSRTLILDLMAIFRIIIHALRGLLSTLAGSWVRIRSNSVDFYQAAMLPIGAARRACRSSPLSPKGRDLEVPYIIVAKYLLKDQYFPHRRNIGYYCRV